MVKRKQGEGDGPPVAGSGKRGTQGHIAYLLRQAQAAARQRIERALTDLGVTYPQFTVMTMIRSYDGLSGADIARLSLLTPQTVTVIVRNLMRDGLVVRQKHPTHGRILNLALSDEGRALLTRCRRRLAPIESSMVADLSEMEEDIVRRWLVGLALRED